MLVRFGPFFVEPVVAGLEPDGKPFICAMDLIGAPVFAEDVALAGTATEAMYGMCESLWKPDMVRRHSPQAGRGVRVHVSHSWCRRRKSCSR